MSHEKDTELNNIKIFGDLNADVPLDTSGVTSLFTNLQGYPIALLPGLADIPADAGNAILIGIGVEIAQEDLVQKQHTTRNLLSTRQQVYVQPPGGITNGNSFQKESLMYPAYTEDKSDGFRQSIGSPWVLSRLTYSDPLNSNEKEDTNVVERLKRSQFGDFDNWRSQGGSFEEYCVLNAFSTPYQDFEALPLTAQTFGLENYSWLPQNYTNKAYIDRIGITSPSVVVAKSVGKLGSEEETYGNWWFKHSPVNGYIEREEFVYILWRDNANAPINTGYEPKEPKEKEISNRLKLLSLFFSIDQKRNGLTIPSSISAQLYGMDKPEELTFDYDGIPFTKNTNSVAYNTHTGFDALLNIEEFAKLSVVSDASAALESEIEYETELDEDGSPVSGRTVIGQQDMPIVANDNPSLQLVKHFLDQYSEVYSDHTFNYSRALDAETSHLYGEELTPNQPTFTVSPFYNYISPAYETVTTQTNISEKSLPNIYEIIEASDNGFDFEKYANILLTCPNSEIEAINSDPKSVEKNNIVIAASTFGKLVGFQQSIYDSGDLYTSEVLGPNVNIPIHARGMSLSTFNEAEESKKFFPFGIQIDFFGDEKIYGGELGNSLSMTNANLKGVPQNTSINNALLFDENIQSGTDTLFSSGIIYDFIKTLIYSHFAGDNLVNPPNMDPEKFAAQGGPPIFPKNGAPIVRAFTQTYAVRRYINEILEPSSITIVPYPDNVWYAEKSQTEYDFLRWMLTYNSDRSNGGNKDSKLYKNNGDIGKVSCAYGNDQIGNVYDQFLSLGTGEVGLIASNFRHWITSNITGHSYFNSEVYDSDHFPQDSLLGEQTQKILPFKLMHRTYKECVSEIAYQDTAYNDANNFPAIQQTIFYRIAKYNSAGELLQNIFIPAHGSVVKGDFSKLPKQFYRYIDTQVKYGELYNYKVSCYKLVMGTSYSYEFAPYDTRYSSNDEASTPYGDATEFVYRRSKRMENWAEKLGFHPEPDDFIFHQDSAGRIMPCFTKVEYTTTGGAGHAGNHGSGSPTSAGVTDALDAGMNDYEHESHESHGGDPGDGPGGPTTGHLPTEWKLLMFAVRSVPNIRIVEVPYFEKMGTMILDKPPLPPLVNIHPLYGKKNDILISFENQTGAEEQFPISIIPSDEEYFTAERVQQNRMLKDKDGNYLNPTLSFKSDDFPSAYEIFRIKGTKPHFYSDFANSEYTKLLVTDATSIVDKIETNTKYYYVFRTIDLHGNMSNPSPLYEVEMVEDSGVAYPIISVVNFATDKNYVYSKSFRKYLKIDASSLQREVNQVKSGLSSGETAHNSYVDPSLGPNANEIWDNNQPYKFRITSKHTGRAFDLNVRFKLRHEDMYDEPTSCYDNLEPGGIISKDLADYVGTDGEGDL